MKHFFLFALLVLSFNARAQWTADSLSNTVVRDSASHEEATPLVAPGPNGSTYFAWFEATRTTNYQLRMQRLDSTGRALWALGGLIVSAQPQGSALFRYDLKSDRNGDAIVAFQDERSGSLLPVVYKVRADGRMVWGTTGIPLTDSLATSGLSPVIGITNANNVVVAWNASSGSDNWVTCQKFSAAGVRQWPVPYRVQGTPGQISYSRPALLATDRDDILLLTIEQAGRFPFVSTPYLERLTPDGNKRWNGPTRVSTGALPFAFFPKLLTDGVGGAYCVFNTGNPANVMLTTVVAQRVRANGSLAWAPAGVEMVTGTASQRYLGGEEVVPTSQGLAIGALLTETDLGQNASGLTCQVIDSAGTVLFGPTGTQLLPRTVPGERAIGLRAGSGHLLMAVSSGTGVLTQSLWARALDLSGRPRWQGNRRAVSVANSGKGNVGLLPVRGGQLVVGWSDDRLGGGNGVYAQSIDTLGHLGGNVPNTLAAPRALLTGAHASVWPNPAPVAALHVQLPAPTPAVLVLLDATGREVWRQTLHLLVGDTVLPLPTGLAPGLYAATLTAPGWRTTARWANE